MYKWHFTQYRAVETHTASDGQIALQLLSASTSQPLATRLSQLYSVAENTHKQACTLYSRCHVRARLHTRTACRRCLCEGINNTRASARTGRGAHRRSTTGLSLTPCVSASPLYCGDTRASVLSPNPSHTGDGARVARNRTGMRVGSCSRASLSSAYCLRVGTAPQLAVRRRSLPRLLTFSHMVSEIHVRALDRRALRSTRRLVPDVRGWSPISGELELNLNPL